MTDVKPPLVIKQFITKAECDALIKFAEASPHSRNAMEPRRYEVAVEQLPRADVLFVLKVIRKMRNRVVAEFGDVPEEHHEDMATISKMLPGSYVEYHADNVRQSGYSWVPNHTAHRTYSAICYLSETHGGELVLPYRNVTVRIEPGTLVGFPSGKDYYHGAEPVIAGVRWALLTWFSRSDLFDLYARLQLPREVDDAHSSE